MDIPVEKVEGTLALNLLCLGNDRGLSFKTNPYVNEVIKSLRLKVYGPDLTEFVDCGGGSHCPTFELAGARQGLDDWEEEIPVKCIPGLSEKAPRRRRW